MKRSCILAFGLLMSLAVFASEDSGKIPEPKNEKKTSINVVTATANRVPDDECCMSATSYYGGYGWEVTGFCRQCSGTCGLAYVMALNCADAIARQLIPAQP